ncbi:MAG: TolC family protein [Proteobacteria bacterium]|nr:TolC family protein [Pseudomonadota bacterium]
MPSFAVRRWVAPWLLVALGLGPASAAPGGQPLTLERAVALALARAPELRAAALARAEAEARLAQTRATAWPRAVAEASYSPHWPINEIRLPATAAGPTLTPRAVDDVHRYQLNLTISERLLDLSRGGREAAAAEGVSQSAAAGELAAARLAFAVRVAFLGALFARDVCRIADESLAQARREAERAALRLSAGAGTQVGLAQARVRVAELLAERRRAEVQQVQQQRTLANLLGLATAPPLAGALEQWSGVRVAVRGAAPPREAPPPVRQLRAAQRAAAHLARSQARTFLPTLSLAASAGLRYPRALALEFGPVLEGALVLSWEAFDSGLRRARVREGEQQAARLGAQAEATAEALARELIDVEARAASAAADLSSAREILRQNEVYLRVARAAVEVGSGTDLDVHQAQLALDRSRIAIQRARFEAALAEAQRLLVWGRVRLPAAAETPEARLEP